MFVARLRLSVLFAGLSSLSLAACTSTDSKGHSDAAYDAQSYEGGNTVDSGDADLARSGDLGAVADLTTIASDDLATTTLVDDLTTSVVADDLATPLDVAAAPPHITTFSAPASACPGTVAVTYEFAGGSGTITSSAGPELAIAPGAGQVDVTLPTTNTQLTLTVTGPGGVATKQLTINAKSLPDATITAPSNAAVHELFSASVNATPSATYAWSIAAGPGSVQSGQTSTLAGIKVTAPGASIDLQVTVDNGVCAATAHKLVMLPCDVPTLVSMYPVGTPDPGPSGTTTRAGDFRSIDNGWVPYLVHKPAWAGFAVFDYAIARVVDGVWGRPASAPHLLNDDVDKVLDVKVAGNSAGDAVMAWTADGVARFVAYRASDDHWSAIHTLSTDTADDGEPITVHVARGGADALITWVEWPGIPHARHYDVTTDTLGVDVPLRSSTTADTSFLPLMNFQLETNSALDGMAAWYERDAGSQIVTLYALHFTAGMPDPKNGGGYDIKAIVVGGLTSVDDLINQWSVPSTGSQRQPRAVAFAENGNAAIVWHVWNGSATMDKGTLYARRYLGGVWGANEIVATQEYSFERSDFGIDDDGAMLLAELETTGGSPAGYRFTHAAAGAAWAPLQPIGGVSGTAALPYLAVDSASGWGVVTFSDVAARSEEAGRAAIWNPTTQTLSAAFTVDDPAQGPTFSPRPFIDGTGEVQLIFTQQMKPLPVGSNSATNALVYSNRCR